LHTLRDVSFSLLRERRRDMLSHRLLAYNNFILAITADLLLRA
jgi:hypothetical protein